MSLFKDIQADLVVAMKAKDTQTLSILRMLMASLKNQVIEFKRELEDADVISVVRSDVKKMNDALGEFVKGEREDLAAAARVEIEVLKKYLPPEMSDEDLEAAVQKVVDEMEDGDAGGMGKAMGAVMKELKGNVDGNRVREIVARLIAPKE
ncbi:GatB/YqeY domain-containing protein [Candidatus Uhrbacteria bacterium]|jgi:uncharacterized protein|nr:GatB/YqeY domain-containing protein [Candidatus Uhrbacteria bacterium]